MAACPTRQLTIYMDSVAVKWTHSQAWAAEGPYVFRTPEYPGIILEDALPGMGGMGSVSFPWKEAGKKNEETLLFLKRL